MAGASRFLWLDQVFLREVDHSGKILYNGELENHEVIPTITRFRALVLPTYHPRKGIPGVIIEAFIAGRPILSTRWKSLAEIVSDGYNELLCDPRHRAQLQRALERLAVDDSFWLSVCNGAKISAGQYSEERVLSGVIDLVRVESEDRDIL